IPSSGGRHVGFPKGRDRQYRPQSLPRFIIGECLVIGCSYFLFKDFKNSSAVITGNNDFLKSFPFRVIIISHSDSVALKYCKASSKSFIEELSPFSIVCSSREHISQSILNFLNFSLAIFLFSNFARK